MPKVTTEKEASWLGACLTIWRRARRGWREDGGSQWVTLSSLTVAFLCLTAASLLLSNLQRLDTGLRARAQLSVYLRDGADDGELQALQTLLGGFEPVRRWHLVTPHEARREFVRAAKSSELANLPSELFPTSLEIYFAPQAGDLAIDQLAKRLRSVQVVEDVETYQPWRQRSTALARAARNTSIALSVLAWLFVLAIVGNTIRLAMTRRQQEIELMKLCGASDRFILAPFLMEGTLLGLLACAAALLLASVGCALLTNLSPIAPALMTPRLVFLAPLSIVALLAVAAALGAAGSALALRRSFRLVGAVLLVTTLQVAKSSALSAPSAEPFDTAATVQRRLRASVRTLQRMQRLQKHSLMPMLTDPALLRWHLAQTRRLQRIAHLEFAAWKRLQPATVAAVAASPHHHPLDASHADPVLALDALGLAAVAPIEALPPIASPGAGSSSLAAAALQGTLRILEAEPAAADRHERFADLSLPLSGTVREVLDVVWQNEPALRFVADGEAIVRASGDGRVLRADDEQNAGIVVLEHSPGVRTAYIGLSRVEARLGDVVGRGATLGRCNSSGLIFQVRRGQRAVDPRQQLGL